MSAYGLLKVIAGLLRHKKLVAGELFEMHDINRTYINHILPKKYDQIAPKDTKMSFGAIWSHFLGNLWFI